MIVGELALDGAVRPVKGVLPIALRALAEGKAAVLEEELDGRQAADALLNQASDPSFFNLTKDGHAID